MSETELDFQVSNMDEIIDVSDDLLQMMEDESLPVGLGAAAAALTLARLVSARKLSFVEGRRFISNIIAFTSTCFNEGSIN